MCADSDYNRDNLASELANLEQLVAAKNQELEQLQQSHRKLEDSQRAWKETEVHLLKAQHAMMSHIRAFIVSFPLGVIVIGGNQRIEAINPNAEILFETTSEALFGNEVSVLFPEVKRLDAITQPMSVMARKRNGETFAAEIFVNDFSSGGATKLFVSVQDITEAHRLEQLRRELIGMVSHDMRAPLSSVLMALDMINEKVYGELSNRGMEVVSEAISVVNYLSSMVVNLLDAEKAEKGTIEISLRETSIGEIVNKAVTAVRLSVEDKSVKIDTDITNDVVTADCDRIAQVLINLISNAVKYSPENGTVTVRAGMEGLNARFQVIDEGPGIPPEMRSLIFERYRQLEQPSELKHKGFGIGLAICKALVEKHNGSISVDNGKLKGSVFSFVIPVSHD